MRLTNRDIDIINFIDGVKGATIEQVQMMFFPSYNTSKRRLSILRDNNYLKSSMHPILNKNIYYTKRMPSYHSLVINHVLIMLKDIIVKAEREFKIGKYKVDALLVLKNKNIIILEVDIFNRTSKEKYINIKKVMDSKGLKFKMLIVEKRKKQKSFCEEILIDEIEKIKAIV